MADAKPVVLVPGIANGIYVKKFSETRILVCDVERQGGMNISTVSDNTNIHPTLSG